MSNAYIGCDYWSVVTPNSNLNFDRAAFGVAIANPYPVDAHVTVSRGGRIVVDGFVAAARSSTVLGLPWVRELAGVPVPSTANSEAISGLVRGGAYHIASTIPVAVYQFNPLSGRSFDGTNFSVTNDASLLLPTHVLGTHHLALSRPSRVTSIGTNATAGFVSVVGAGEGMVHVEITGPSHFAAGPDGSVPAIAPGEVFGTDLGPGDVLQLVGAVDQSCASETTPVGDDGLLCFGDRNHDPTGTVIASSGPVLVIAGHDLAWVPAACGPGDHLEEVMPPTTTWGLRVPVIASATIEGVRDTVDVVVVVSASDNNVVTFKPEVHPSATLQRNDILEIQTSSDFVVEATRPVLVGQYLTGQECGVARLGDPSLTVAVPEEQWKPGYVFAVPPGYDVNRLNIVSGSLDSVRLDGQVVEGFVSLEGSDLRIAKIAIEAGSHTLESMAPFGASVYGFTANTSYWYPAGLQLHTLQPPPE